MSVFKNLENCRVCRSKNFVEVIKIDDMHIKNVPHCFNIYATKNESNIKKYNLKLSKNVHPKLLWHESKKYFWPK